MYSNNILKFQESTKILNAYTKKSLETYWMHHVFHMYRLISLVGRVFANGPGDLGSIPGRIIPKTLKMVLDTSLNDTQKYKECIKGKVEQFRERSSTLSYTSVK